MTILFSATTLGFYDADIAVTLPDDAVEITADKRKELLDGQSNGMIIAADSARSPVLLEYVAPPPNENDVKSLVSSTRYNHEVAGITVNGTAINTSRDSQALITGATVQAMLDSQYACTWKTASGPVQLNATQLIAIATAVRAHVQACFDREGVLLTAVADKSFTEAMLAEGWPT